MSFSKETKRAYIDRHTAYYQLIHFLDVDKEDYFQFLDLLSKLESEDNNLAEIECYLRNLLMFSLPQLKKVFFSSEWQKAKRIFKNSLFGTTSCRYF